MKDLFSQGMAKMQAGDYSAAMDFFRRLLRKNPRHIDGLYLLGTLEAESGNFTSAADLLSRAAKLAPTSPFIANNMGNVYMQQGEPDKAIACFKRALSFKPDLVEAAVNIGALMLRVERPDDAVQSLEYALKLRPGHAEAMYNLGLAYLETDRAQGAVDTLRRLLAVVPDLPRGYETLGRALARLGERDEAIKCLKHYLQIAGTEAGQSDVELLLSQLESTEPPPRYPVEAIKKTYERKAYLYDAAVDRSGMEFLGVQLVAQATAQLYAGDAVLDVADIGCGTGLCGVFLRPLAARLDGVDLSQPMLDKAAQKGLYDHLACQDLVEYLEARRSSYDLVTASGVLILFGDLLLPLKAAAAALKPGGRFIFTLYASNGGDVEIRKNLHFAHSRSYIEAVCSAAGLVLELLREEIHEYDAGEAQSGFVVSAVKPL